MKEYRVWWLDSLQRVNDMRMPKKEHPIIHREVKVKGKFVPTL